MQRLGTVGILGILRGLQPERGLLATRGGFIECLAGFDIIQTGHITLPDFYFGFCHAVEWYCSYSCSHVVLLQVLRYWDSGEYLMHWLCFGGMKTSLLAPLFGLGQGSCTVCTAAQPYNGALYHPTQYSTALCHWALHHAHYIWPKCWRLMLGKP